jgi:hypothetical protein
VYIYQTCHPTQRRTPPGRSGLPSESGFQQHHLVALVFGERVDTSDHPHPLQAPPPLARHAVHREPQPLLRSLRLDTASASVFVLLYQLLRPCLYFCTSKASVLSSWLTDATSVAALLQLCCSSVAASVLVLSRTPSRSSVFKLLTSMCGLRLLVYAALSY